MGLAGCRERPRGTSVDCLIGHVAGTEVGCFLLC